MNIGALARELGTPAKTIRYYESIGLVPEPARSANGYRSYATTDMERLRFILRSRALGFSIKEIAGLLELWNDRSRASADVKHIALQHVSEIEQRISELQSIRQTLIHLTEKCHGDDRPDCPILDDLAGGE